MRFSFDKLECTFELPDGWQHLSHMFNPSYPESIFLVSNVGQMIFEPGTIKDIFIDNEARKGPTREAIQANGGMNISFLNTVVTLGGERNVIYAEFSHRQGTRACIISAVHGKSALDIWCLGNLEDARFKEAVQQLISSFEFKTALPQRGSPAAIQEVAMHHLNENQQFHDDAAEGRLAEVVQSIQRGIDINSRNPSGGTALMIAAKRGHLHVVKALLEASADPNVALHQITYRALHTAAQEGHEEIIAALLEHGADINAATQYGETALISAAYHGQSSIVELLLSRGADPSRTDREGNTASDWARKMGHPSTARILDGAETKRGLLSRLLSFLR